MASIQRGSDPLSVCPASLEPYGATGLISVNFWSPRDSARLLLFPEQRKQISYAPTAAPTTKIFKWKSFQSSKFQNWNVQSTERRAICQWALKTGCQAHNSLIFSLVLMFRTILCGFKPEIQHLGGPWIDSKHFNRSNPADEKFSDAVKHSAIPSNSGLSLNGLILWFIKQRTVFWHFSSAICFGPRILTGLGDPCCLPAF